MIIFVDTEVFKHDWIVVFIIPQTKETIVIHNDKDKLLSLYAKYKDSIFIGYNIRGYDQYIIKSILLGLNPKEVNDFIIVDRRFGWEYSNAFNDVQLYFYDAMVKGNSLKQLEGFMGESMVESEVSFDIDRPLTPPEIDSTIKYCQHDVEQLICVFMNTKEEFDSQVSLLRAFNLPMKYISKTKPQLSAIILGASKCKRNDEFKLILPDTLRIDKYSQIVDWYKNIENMDYEKQQQVYVDDVPHIFAWGGLHGAIENYIDEGIFLSLDVASFYPAIMIEYDFLSRNVQSKDEYRKIRDERIRLKAQKDPMQAPYKIVLNSTYGASKDKYNSLYDPLMANNVCIAGQLLLLDLIEKLEGHWKLIQSNTDGLIGKVDSMEQIERIKKICSEWEQRTRMVLEYDVYSKIIQKDVNNYIIVKADGKYKSKGAYVKKLSPIDNDLPIVNKAIVDYFINGVAVEETIIRCNRLIEFQKVVKISYKYQGAVYGDEPIGKCFRVFASREIATCIRKLKEGKKHKIANVPENCFINNENIIDARCPRKLDKSWYIDLAHERIRDFEGVALPYEVY